jgi:dGTPase
VFVFHEGDHYRTRLTHTLEVAQIARSLARALALDEDLSEALALAHDLGHPPFGHAGERALDHCLRDAGGFDHNAQTLRAVTALERRYASFDGLNLTWETLEGLVKHNGPLTDRDGRPVGRYRARGVPQAILDYDRMHDLHLWSFASAEAQVAAIADDIAYDAHDIDDGLRAELFTLDDLAQIVILRELLAGIRSRHPAIEETRLGHELVRRLIANLIVDVIAETRERLDRLAPASADDVRGGATPVAAFSKAMGEGDRAIKDFLYSRMYRHARIERIMGEAETVVRDLFGHYLEHPDDLPVEWTDGIGTSERTRRIADFIAGMTDRYALIEHARLFKTTPELR